MNINKATPRSKECHPLQKTEVTSAGQRKGSVWPVFALKCAFLIAVPLDAFAQAESASSETFLKGWDSKVVNAEISSVSEAEATPLSPDEKKYVHVEGTIDGTESPSYGATFLNYVNPAGPDARTKIRFLFRPDSTGKIRYFFFDADLAQPSTGPNATWHIDCVGGFWRIMAGGTADGDPEQQIKTDIKASAGTVYSFVIETDPQERKWSVTISDGTEVAVFKDLHFRSKKQELGGYLHFGFSADGAQKPSEFAYSFADVHIDNAAEAKP